MKKIFDKKTIFILIICGTLFTGIGVGAVFCTASDVSYNPKDGVSEVANVDAALNELYDKKNIFKKINEKFSFTYGLNEYNKILELNDLENGEYSLLISMYAGSNGSVTKYYFKIGEQVGIEKTISSTTNTSSVSYRPIIIDKIDFEINNSNKTISLYALLNSKEKTDGYYTLIKK